jgi:hypothetical protein
VQPRLRTSVATSVVGVEDAIVELRFRVCVQSDGASIHGGVVKEDNILRVQSASTLQGALLHDHGAAGGIR